MSSYPFHVHNEGCPTKMGTGGGWVCASSGYSFKNADRNTAQLVQNIKKGVKPAHDIQNQRHETYDSLFLQVLTDQNELGEQIFSALYEKHLVQRIFKFLDGESSLAEDAKVILSLNHPAFRKALISRLKGWLFGTKIRSPSLQTIRRLSY